MRISGFLIFKYILHANLNLAGLTYQKSSLRVEAGYLEATPTTLGY